MPNFSIPLSGLQAASQTLSVISNNLANLNTVGYKASQASFRDLFYQAFGTNGANDPIQVGEGVAINSVTPIFTSGNLQGTGVNTDAAITGSGFFVTQRNGALQFTRAGNFTPDEARAFLTTLLTDGGAQICLPGPGFADRLLAAARQLKINGPHIFDLQIAVIALEHGATEIWTHDRNFVSVPGLPVHDPLPRRRNG